MTTIKEEEETICYCAGIAIEKGSWASLEVGTLFCLQYISFRSLKMPGKMKRSHFTSPE